MLHLGRGILTGAIRQRNDITNPSDYRLIGQPKYAEGNFDKNLELILRLESIAFAKQCTIGQIALAWLHAQGPDVIPIPGTSHISHLEENLKARNIELSLEEVSQINSIFTVESVVGERYLHKHSTYHGNEH